MGLLRVLARRASGRGLPRPEPGADAGPAAPRSGAALTMTSKAYSAMATGFATERINQA